jgi:hypothetical protein
MSDTKSAVVQQIKQSKFICSACGSARDCDCAAPALERLSEIKEQSRQRVRPYRERKREENQRTCNVTPAAREEQVRRTAEQIKEQLIEQARRMEQGGADAAREFLNGVGHGYDEERHAEHDLAIRMIDAGYRTMARVSHPDVGGSKDTMAQLNRVRDRLRELAVHDLKTVH